MSTLAQQWLEQGRQEGWQKGRQEGRQEGQQEGQKVAMRQNIVELLDVRLQVATQRFRDHLETVDDLETLRLLVRRAATVDSVAEFEQALATLIEKS